jgi:hypothetical protein
MFDKLKNLNDAWVIVSRHNGNIFFKRKNYVTRLKNYPDNNCIFYSEIEARETLSLLNQNRKSCKYELENASKYFVNSFNYNSWNNYCIINAAIPIKKVQEGRVQIRDVKELKKTIIQSLESSIQNQKNDIIKTQKSISYAENKLEWLRSDNLEKGLEPYETKGDKLVKLLFAKTPEKPKATQDDEVPF